MMVQPELKIMLLCGTLTQANKPFFVNNCDFDFLVTLFSSRDNGLT